MGAVTQGHRPAAALPSHSCAVWMEHVVCSVSAAGEEKLVDKNFLLPWPGKETYHCLLHLIAQN